MTWQPIETAPKDGQPVLVRFKADLRAFDPSSEFRLERWQGIAFVARHHGYTDSGYDMGWGFAAPVGQGGFPDDWLAGWTSLPPPPRGGAGGGPEITGHLKNARLIAIGDSLHAVGEFHGDARRRFADGVEVTTSAIVGFDNDRETIITENSVYTVAPWHNLVFCQLCRTVTQATTSAAPPPREGEE